MKNYNKIDLKMVVHLLDQGNADIAQYVTPQVEQILRKRLWQIQCEERRKALPWIVKVIVNMFRWCLGIKNEPLWVSKRFSDSTEGILYEMTLDIISNAGPPIGQDQPQDRTVAIQKKLKHIAGVIAYKQYRFSCGFTAPEILREISLERENWETLFVYFQMVMKDLPKEHKLYWD